MTEQTAEYVAARSTLLDALDALHEHHDSLVLVGSQAVYLHTGNGDFAIPPTTTDSDLALDADLLADAPEISTALQAAGFSNASNPGHWVSPHGVAVDLMVPPHTSGRTKPSARAADLKPHSKQTARIAPGLALALLDNTSRNIASLDPTDGRVHHIRVAGPTALLVAKTTKARERIEAA